MDVYKFIGHNNIFYSYDSVTLQEKKLWMKFLTGHVNYLTNVLLYKGF